jgi:hypothetical protein
MLLALAAIFLAVWIWEITGNASLPPWIHLFLLAGASSIALHLCCVPHGRESPGAVSDEAGRQRRASTLLHHFYPPSSDQKKKTPL